MSGRAIQENIQWKLDIHDQSHIICSIFLIYYNQSLLILPGFSEISKFPENFTCLSVV